VGEGKKKKGKESDFLIPLRVREGKEREGEAAGLGVLSNRRGVGTVEGKKEGEREGFLFLCT